MVSNRFTVGKTSNPESCGYRPVGLPSAYSPQHKVLRPTARERYYAIHPPQRWAGTAGVVVKQRWGRAETQPHLHRPRAKVVPRCRLLIHRKCLHRRRARRTTSRKNRCEETSRKGDHEDERNIQPTDSEHRLTKPAKQDLRTQVGVHSAK